MGVNDRYGTIIDGRVQYTNRKLTDPSPFFANVHALRSDPVCMNGIIGARYFTDQIVKKLLPLVEWLDAGKGPKEAHAIWSSDNPYDLPTIAQAIRAGEHHEGKS